MTDDDGMKNLSSNRELHEYLSSLSSALKRRGLHALCDILDVALGNASSSSTEFLGESRIALRSVLNDGGSSLTGEERIELADVLEQLDEAFTKR